MPVVDLNYLDHPDAVAGNIRAVQQGLKMFQQSALQAIIKQVTEPAQILSEDGDAIEAWMRQNIKTVYHLGGSCCIGVDRQKSVTDLQLKVHGMKNLRVIDCLICPQVPSGNTNAIAIMIGERGADFILNP